jgi:linoleoyl-CoA desaturase
LFPRICHVHYTALYKIVDHVCDELGVERQKSLSLWSAVGSHLGYLRRLGQPSPPAVAGAGAKSQPAPAVPVA